MPKPAVAVAPPPELTRAMAKHAAARVTWERLAPSHKREYAQWITGAKKDETRTRRIEQAVALLTEGRSTPMRANDAPAVSAAPLGKKLGLKAGQKAVVLGAPDGMSGLIDGAATSGKGDVVLAFARDAKDLGAVARKAIAALVDGGSLWVAYPKKTSGIATDLSRDHGWEPLKKAGWEGVALVAVNEAWAAMRFRRE